MTVILLPYRLVVGYTISPSLVPHELTPCQVRIFDNNLEFSFIFNCRVPSLMLFYNLMQATWSAKVKFVSYWVIIDVAQTHRIPSDSLSITALSIIETYPWA